MAVRRCSLPIAALACGAAGQGLAAWGTGAGSFVLAAALFTLGGAALALAGAAGQSGSDVAAEPTRAPRLRGRSAALLAAALLLGGLAASYVGEALSPQRLVSYVAALTAIVALAVDLDRDAPPRAGAPAWSAPEIGLVLALAVLAFGLRLWRLSTLPGVIWDDEILYLHDAIVVPADAGLPSPFASGTWGAPYLHAYLIAASSWLIDDRAVALRLVSAIPGALTVPFLYLALRELFDRRVAFFGAVLLALSCWAILLSRHGYVWAVNGFAEAVVLWALARGLRSRRMLDFAVAGAFLALGVVYSYAAALMPLVLAAFFALQLVLHGRSAVPVAGWAMLALTAAVGVAPRVTAMLTNPEMRGYQKLALVAGGEEESAAHVVARQLGEIAVSFHRRADANPHFVPAPKEPLLDPVTAAALGLGIGWTLWSWRHAGAQLLLLTFGVMLLPPAVGLSSTEWATAWRACGVLPGLFGLAGVPFAVLLATPRSRAGRMLAGALAAGALGLVAVINLHGYFVRHPTKPGWHDGPKAQRMRSVERLEAARGDRLLVNHDVESDYTRALLRGRLPYEVFAWPDDEPLPPLRSTGPRSVVVADSGAYWEDDVGAGAILIELLRHYYPLGRAEDVRGRGGERMLAVYVVEPEQVAAAHGLESSSPALRSGTLVAPADGAYRFADAGGGEVEVAIDGRAFTSGFLPRGLHAIALQDSPSAALWWSVDGAPLEAVPEALLLRRGLPSWGFLERGGDSPERSGWQRWVPALWYTAPERAFGPTGDGPVRWTGEVELPSGEYQVLLRSRTPSTLLIDGEPLLENAVAWPAWVRLPHRFERGWHTLEVGQEPPIAYRDLEVFWIDSAGSPGLFGGANSRWARTGTLVR